MVEAARSGTKGVEIAGEGPLGWGHAEDRLARSRSYWVSSVRAGGGPHAAPVWGVWVEGTLYFGTGRASVKGRNLARLPELVVHLESADDVVILEGVVEEVVDPGTFGKIDEAYRAKYGMGVTEAGDSGAVWYAVRPRRAHAWLEDDFPNTATRWTFREGPER